MIDKLIGNTPIVKIKYRYKGKVRNIYSKLEYYNYTGSIKYWYWWYFNGNFRKIKII